MSQRTGGGDWMRVKMCILNIPICWTPAHTIFENTLKSRKMAISKCGDLGQWIIWWSLNCCFRYHYRMLENAYLVFPFSPFITLIIFSLHTFGFLSIKVYIWLFPITIAKNTKQIKQLTHRLWRPALTSINKPRTQYTIVDWLMPRNTPSSIVRRNPHPANRVHTDTNQSTFHYFVARARVLFYMCRAHPRSAVWCSNTSDLVHRAHPVCSLDMCICLINI